MEQLEQIPIDQVIRMAETLDKYGALIVMGGGFIVIALMAVMVVFMLLMKQSRNKDTQHQDMLRETMKQNNLFIEKTLSMVNPLDMNANLVKSSVNCNSAITERLKYTSAVIKCDRVSLYMFHNGQRMLNGAHILKFSCLAEYASLPQYYYSDKHKDKPVSMIQPICNALLESHEFELLDSSKTEKDSVISQWFDLYPAKSFFVKAVFNTESVLMGFVMAGYFMEKVDKNKVENIKLELKRLADKVCVAMDLNLINNE